MKIYKMLTMLLTFAAMGPYANAAVLPALAGSIYVDCSSPSPGDGGLGSPFNSLAALKTTILPGATIYFKRGVRCIGQFSTYGSGTAENPIRVTAYGAGTAFPIIDGNGVAGKNELGSAVYLLNQEYWRISDIEVTNNAATISTRNGIAILLRDFVNGTGTDGKPQGAAREIHLKNVYVHDVAGGGGTTPKDSNGIQFGVAGTGVANWFDGISVTDSRVSDVGREGLVTITVQKCRQYMDCSPNDPGNPVLNQWRPQRNVVFKRNIIENIRGDGIVIRASTGALVQDNIGRNLATQSWPDAASAGFWAINSDNTEFSFNEVSGTKKTVGNNDGTAFDADYTNFGIIFKQNYTHDNEGGFMLLCGSCGGSRNTGVVVRDNISVNDGNTAKRLIYAAGSGYKDASGNAINGAEFYGNTFYLPTTSSFAILDVSNGTNAVKFRNNIIYTHGPLSTARGTTANLYPTWANNIFHGMDAAAVPAGSNSLLVNPQFAGVLPTSGPWPTDYAPSRNHAQLGIFKLANWSPARQAGALIYSTSTGDFFGGTLRPRYCAPDIGAHQATVAAPGCL